MVGVGAGAAGAVAAQGAVHVGGEVVGEVRDLEAALQARLPAQAAPGAKNGKIPQNSSKPGLWEGSYGMGEVGRKGDGSIWDGVLLQ